MSAQPPSPQRVWDAIEVYLAVAYEGAPQPAAVRARLETLRSAGAEGFYGCTVFEREGEPPTYRLRLGNPFYPHMKLVIDHAPDGGAYFFRADAHDQHVRPDPQSREYPLFLQLTEKNQAMVERIESAWEERGLPTFKSYLREDLERRARQGGGGLSECE